MDSNQVKTSQSISSQLNIFWARQSLHGLFSQSSEVYFLLLESFEEDIHLWWTFITDALSPGGTQKSARWNDLSPHGMRWKRNGLGSRKYQRVFHNYRGENHTSAPMSAYND